MLSDSERWGDIIARTENEAAIGSIPIARIKAGKVVTEDLPLLHADAERIFGVHHIDVQKGELHYWERGCCISLLPHPKTDPSLYGVRVADAFNLGAARGGVTLLTLHAPGLSCLLEKSIGGKGIARRGSYLETWLLYRDISESLARVGVHLYGRPPLEGLPYQARP